MISRFEPKRSLNEHVRYFIRSTGIPLKVAAEGLGLPAHELLEWWRQPEDISKNKIHRRNIHLLSQFLNIHEDSIVEGNFDKNLIRQRIYSDSLALPEEYSKNQFSYLRTSGHIIKYLTMTRGQHFSDRILRSMNLSPLLFNNLSSRMSLNFFIDLLHVVSSSGLTQKELDTLPCMLFLSLQNSELGNKFAKAKTYYQCYSVLAENLHHFDDNFIYSCYLEKNCFHLRAFLPFDKHSQIDWKNTNLSHLLEYRRVVFGWFPYLSKLTPLKNNIQIEYLKDGVLTHNRIDFPMPSTKSLYLVDDSSS